MRALGALERNHEKEMGSKRKATAGCERSAVLLNNQATDRVPGEPLEESERWCSSGRPV